MHELSIAAAIARVAEEHAGGRRVAAVSVKAGRLRQVAPSVLEFAFELVTQGTSLQGARLELEDVPVAVRCERCDAHSAPQGFPLSCELCGALEVEITAGEELTVDEIELEEMEVAAI